MTNRLFPGLTVAAVLIIAFQSTSMAQGDRRASQLGELPDPHVPGDPRGRDRLHRPAARKALGVGEPAAAVVPAAIANAVWDAARVRLRSVPFTPERCSPRCSARESRPSNRLRMKQRVNPPGRCQAAAIAVPGGGHSFRRYTLTIERSMT
jgi:hypothetical protein